MIKTNLLVQDSGQERPTLGYFGNIQAVVLFSTIKFHPCVRGLNFMEKKMFLSLFAHGTRTKHGQFETDWVFYRCSTAWWKWWGWKGGGVGGGVQSKKPQSKRQRKARLHNRTRSRARVNPNTLTYGAQEVCRDWVCCENSFARPVDITDGVQKT